MDNFDSEKFERRLLNLKNTQDAITGLSQWCLAKRTAHKQIVRSWLKILKEVKIESRLILFYLANDVIQHSKRKNYDFVESWGTSLQRATTLVRDDKVKEKISRIFNIWEQREVYSEEFIADLNGLLSINTLKKPSIASTNSSGSSPVNSTSSKQNLNATIDEFDDDFQVSSVINGIRNVVELENETNKHLTVVVKTSVPDLEKIRNNLKDRSHVEEAEQAMETAANKFQTFMSSLKEEIQARKTLLTALDQADKFYKNQRKDVKKVVYAYKNFGDRINQISTDLESKIPTLQSPCPSPPINAPSPEPDNDFDLPNEMSFYKSNMNMNGYGSFLKDNAPLPFDPNEFYRSSPPLPTQNTNSIQVIQQQSAPINDFYNPLSQPKIDSYNPQMGYQPPLPAQVDMNHTTFPPNQGTSYRNMNMIPPPPPSASHVDYTSGIPLPPSQTDNYSPWNWNSNNIETPHSPPIFERKGRDENMVEYIDESLRNITDANDIDQRRMMRTSESDGSGHDVDHRNLISLTGSPANNNGDETNHRLNNQFLTPPLDPSHFNKFNNMNDSDDLSNYQMMSGRMMPRQQQQQQGNGGGRSLIRNPSYNSDSSRNDEIETVDMEMSDDDTGVIDNQSVGSSTGGDNRDFSMPNMYQLPNQINLNRPPPMMNPINQEWMHNQTGNEPMMHEENHQPENQFSGPPPMFMNPSNRGNFQQSPNFRGHRGGKMIRMGSPFNHQVSPNFRGGPRGGMNNRGRGGGRGVFRGNGRGAW